VEKAVLPTEHTERETHISAGDPESGLKMRVIFNKNGSKKIILGPNLGSISVTY